LKHLFWVTLKRHSSGTKKEVMKKIKYNTYSGSFVAGTLLDDEITALLPLLMHADR